MAILTAKKVWRRERTKPRLHAQLAVLTPAEQANVLAFAKKLRARSHSWEAFARRAGVQPESIMAKICDAVRAAKTLSPVEKRMILGPDRE